MKLIPGESRTPGKKFSEIEHEKIMTRMKDTGKIESKIPRRIKNLIREEKTINKLLYMLPSIKKNCALCCTLHVLFGELT